jgi:bla regulator protein BlaR1
MTKKKKGGMSLAAVIVGVVLILVVAALGTGYLYFKAKYAGTAVAYSRDQIRNLDENSFDYKIAKLFYTDEELSDIRNYTVTDAEETTDSGETLSSDGIEIKAIHGVTYEGYLMIVHNPEDIEVAVNPNMDSGNTAPSLEEYVSSNNAIAGINAGGFEDAGGTGNGGNAWGIVIHDGQLISGDMDSYLPVIGIDSNHKLVCADTTARQALEWGIQEAVTFGPVFISNYQVVFTSGDYPMTNPRTAIAQREDGAFMLLVIDGRGPTSFGALYEDCIQIFQDNNAVEAANLDGGNSSAMIYNGQYVNTTVSMYRSRHLPTAILVKGGN